jgi:hypothetical protein
MKVTWEADDIVPGRRYSKKGIGEKWIIGYLSDVAGEGRYVSVSDRDGLVTSPGTKEYLANALNEEGYLPVELIEGT